MKGKLAGILESNQDFEVEFEVDRIFKVWREHESQAKCMHACSLRYRPAVTYYQGHFGQWSLTLVRIKQNLMSS